MAKIHTKPHNWRLQSIQLPNYLSFALNNQQLLPAD